MFSRAIALVLALSIVGQGLAWNRVGHLSIAGAAYAKLTPKARAQVDDMLRKHPDYAWFAAETPTDPVARARAVFMKAAYWPDHIKGDPRFYDEAKNVPPTPTLPGFPHMKQHHGWHYYDIPFSFDGTPTTKHPEPHMQSMLQLILKWRGGPEGEDQVYMLPWLLHLMGDVHQPLHCTARYMKGQVDDKGRPTGDQGGNLVILETDRNLHSLWDGALGSTLTDAFIDGVTNTLIERAPASPGSLNPKKWVKEGYEIAKRDVYSFGNQTGTKEKPMRLPDGYVQKMRILAIQRGALAGVRIAAILNEKLK